MACKSKGGAAGKKEMDTKKKEAPKKERKGKK